MRQLLSVSEEQGKEIARMISIEYNNYKSSPELIFDLNKSEFKALDQPVTKICRHRDIDKILSNQNTSEEFLYSKRYGHDLVFDNTFSDVLQQNELFLNVFKITFDEKKDHAVVEKINIDRNIKNFSATIYAMLRNANPESHYARIINVLATELSQYEMNILITEGHNYLLVGDQKYSDQTVYENLFRYLYTGDEKYIPFKIEVKDF